MNRFFYTRYGHTYLGLADAGLTLSHTFEHYNEFVYENPELLIETSPTQIYSAARAVRTTLEILVAQGIELAVFTNAPRKWCDYVLMTTGLDEFISHRITCEDPKLLKPAKLAFDSVEKRFPNRRLHFIDDTESNLQAIRDRPDWTAYHYGRELNCLTELERILCDTNQLVGVT